MRSSAGYSDTYQSYPNALQYAYRADGKRDRLTLGNGSAFTWAYTAAGRLQTQTDPLTGTTIHPDATYTIGKGAPHFYYPSGVTYGPWTQGFDSYGRVSTISLPVTPFSYTGSQYDLDDGFAQQTFSAASLTNSPYPPSTIVCLKSTVRNEKFPDVAYPQQPCSGPFPGPPAAAEVNGTQLNNTGPANPSGLPRGGAAPWTLDARAGILLRNVGTATSGAAGESVGASYAYDPSGRLNQDFEGYYETITSSPTSNPTFTQAWCPTGLITNTNPSNTCYSNGSRANTYDAENRLRTETFTTGIAQYTQTSYGYANYGRYWADSSGYGQPPNLQAVDYGETSHPMRFTLYHPDAGASYTETRVWLWDGNDRLLECQFSAGRCQSPTLSMEGLGDYNLAAGTIVRINDRNRNGAVTMARDTVGFSAWKDQRTRINSNKYAPCSIDGGSDQIGYYPPNICSAQHNGKLTADGWTLDYESWQGVRSSDLAVGQWNTPDAYAGEVHDPMSQKPFMWNRNNSYQYADPTGFEYVTRPLFFDASATNIAMNPSAQPAPSDVMNAVRDAVARAIHNTQQSGGDLLKEIEYQVNQRIGKVEGGKYAVSLKPDNRPDRVALKNSNGQLRIYQSGTHGGRTDTSVRIQYNVYRAVLKDRMGWDTRLGEVYTTNGNTNINAPRLPFVPFGSGKVNEGD
jgi:YD repeat-containing protein